MYRVGGTAGSRRREPRSIKEASTADGGENSHDDSIMLINEHVEETSENGKKIRHKGIYLLPNLFTTGALFSGFYAILISISGQFDAAAIAILVAQLLDGLDGRVARLTNTSSVFGTQYDSLSDVVSFGLAPAIVAFNWGLIELGKIGWAAAFIFTACAALRLARFNAQTENTGDHSFTGLASPPAAAFVVCVVWVWHDREVSQLLAGTLALAMTVLAFLMVSNFKYNSLKGLDLKRRVPFVFMLLVVFIFTLIVIHSAFTLFCIVAAYCASGPIVWVFKRIRCRDKAMAVNN